ncbi:MAG: hypothetical protein ABJI69_00425 [Balneola sp.]
MVQIIKKSDSVKSSKKRLIKKKHTPENEFDAKKYCGIINWDIDGIEYQREARKDRIETAR